jgi:serine/threonine-protein kinase
VNEPLDKILKAAYQSDGAPSILRRIEQRGGKAPRVLLREPAESETPVHRPSGGEQQGRYEVVGEIARGGVGVILKGRDIDLGRDVAMKVLHERHADNTELLERFIEEAQVGGQLQHPGIVPVYELGLQRDGRPFFAMKLVKGRTLANVLADRKDPTEKRGRLLEAFARTCETMAYAHARGVIHRDIKPSNIMLGNYGEVLVVDWGFAKILGTGGIADEQRATRTAQDVSVIASVRSEGEGSSGSVAGSVMGTPAYMPPEQALGEIEQLDERSDVFSLGGILCEILTGKPPYVGERHDLLVMAAQAKLDDARERIERCGADPELERICLDCLEPMRARRPKNAAELAERVRAHLAGIEDRARGAEIEAARAHTRRRLSLALAAVILVAAGLGIWIQNENHDRNTAARAEVAAALGQASERLGAGDWDAAEAGAQRAVELARVAAIEDGGASALIARAREQREAQERAAAHARELERRRAALIDARFHVEPEFSAKERDAAFRAAIDAAESLPGNPLRDEIIAALDAWGGDPDRLAADPDERRRAIREAESAGVPDDLAGLPWPTRHLIALRLADDGKLDRARGILLEESARLHAVAALALVEHRQTGAGRGRRHAARLLDEMGESDLPAMALWRLMRLLEARQYRPLIDALRQAKERGKLPDRTRRLLAKALLELGISLTEKLVPESVAILRQALELNPEDPLTHFRLGRAYMIAIRDAHRAVPHLRRYVDAHPTDSVGLENLGLALSGVWDVDGALASLQAGLPTSIQPSINHMWLANLFVRKQDYRRALDHYERASADPKVAFAAQRSIAQILLVMGNGDAALKRAAALYRRFPRVGDLAALYSRCCRAAGDRDAFRAYTEQQMRLIAPKLERVPVGHEWPSAFGAYIGYLEEPESAEAVLASLRRYVPAPEPRIEALVLAGWGHSRALATGDPEDWRRMLARASELAPSDEWIEGQHRTYAFLVLRESDPAALEEAQIEKIKEDPADLWRRRGLVWALVQSGRYDLAIDVAESARLPEGLGRSTDMEMLIASARRLRDYDAVLEAGKEPDPGPEPSYDELWDLAIANALRERWSEAATWARRLIEHPRGLGREVAGKTHLLRDAVLRAGDADAVALVLRRINETHRTSLTGPGFRANVQAAGMFLAGTIWSRGFREVLLGQRMEQFTPEQREAIETEIAELRRLVDLIR